MSYRIYGLTLESAEPLPELASASISPLGRVCDVRFRREASSLPLRPERWFMHWRLPTGEPWLSAARGSDGYALRFHGLADFLLDAGGREIVCTHSACHGSPETVRHLLIDHVLPLVLNLRGVEALHASAVLAGAGAIVFTGPSGAGKSTIAAEFARAGDAVLADDCVAVLASAGRFRVLPAYPGLRLRRDAMGRLGAIGNDAPLAGYTDKRRLALGVAGSGAPREPHPLLAVYALDDVHAAEFAVRALAPRDAAMELLSRAFRFEIEDRAMLARQLDFFARVAMDVPVFRVSAPRDLDRLPELRRAIRAHVAARGVSK